MRDQGRRAERAWPDVLAHAVGSGVGLGPHESNPTRASTPPAAWAASGRRPRCSQLRGITLLALRTKRRHGMGPASGALARAAGIVERRGRPARHQPLLK